MALPAGTARRASGAAGGEARAAAAAPAPATEPSGPGPSSAPQPPLPPPQQVQPVLLLPQAAQGSGGSGEQDVGERGDSPVCSGYLYVPRPSPQTVVSLVDDGPGAPQPPADVPRTGPGLDVAQLLHPAQLLAGAIGCVPGGATLQGQALESGGGRGRGGGGSAVESVWTGW
jgi:hypothetical protein